MPDLLFVYGTLRDPDLLAAVLARPLDISAILVATAPGFRAVRYGRRAYPALVHAPGGREAGLVLTDIDRFEFDLLDAYEGREYRRAMIPVMIEEELHEAFAYLPAVAVAADAAWWSLDEWQNLHKPRVLAAERLLADDLRLKLLASRPH